MKDLTFGIEIELSGLSREKAAKALTQKSASVQKTRTTNSKYAFRTQLLRLGLIGEEFETARLHLLKNLEDDSAQGCKEPSDGYYRIIEEGYRDWELPAKPLQEALERSR